MRLGAVRARIAAEMLDPVALVRFDADLGVEVEAFDARLAACGQEHDAEVGLGGVVRGMSLGAVGAHRRVQSLAASAYPQDSFAFRAFSWL